MYLSHVQIWTKKYKKMEPYENLTTQIGWPIDQGLDMMVIVPK
jgi:hypothetical protein